MLGAEYSSESPGAASIGGLAGGWLPQQQPQHELQHELPAEAALQALRDYVHERPEVVAVWAFGLGFFLGWRLKPW